MAKFAEEKHLMEKELAEREEAVNWIMRQHHEASLEMLIFLTKSAHLDLNQVFNRKCP